MAVNKFIMRCFIVCLAIGATQSSFAGEFEFTPWVGQMYSSDLKSVNSGDELSVSSDAHLGFSIAWQDTPNGQGQVLINAVSHDFKSDVDNETYSMDIYYVHFNGIAQFRQQRYVTTVSLGLGGTYVDTTGGEDLYPSLTAAIGTRYEFSDNISLVTELRSYASLTDEDSKLFCNGDDCVAEYDSAIWVDTAISVGIAYKF